MKVRWTEESLRVRLTPTELATLIHGDEVVQRLDLGGGGWEIHVTPSGGVLGVAWKAGVVVVSIPPQDVALLAEPDREGVYSHRPNLRLLVEKDFPCAHPHAVDAEEPDTERFAPTRGFLERKTAHRP
jgi:hypothetical protein